MTDQGGITDHLGKAITHDPVAGVGAQPAPVVEGDPVRSGLHVEGQRTYGGDGGPVGFGRRADFEHGVENLSIWEEAATKGGA
jgi:hypothetical protein